MNITLNSCPYCGSGVSELDSETLVCLQCGKRLCVNRTADFSLSPETQKEGMMSIHVLMEDRLYEEALKRIDQIIKEAGKEDANLLLIRGTILSYMGEDGKAFLEWDKAIKLIGDVDDFDYYFCFICKTVARMIYYKELEFIEFEFVKYINRIVQMFADVVKCPIKSFTFYTIFVNYIYIATEKAEEGDEPVLYILPQLFRNVVVYYRDYPNLRRVVEEYLDFLGYNEDTYEDDGMEQCHLYDIVSRSIDDHCHCLEPEDLKRVKEYWNDENMSELDEDFAVMEKYIRSNKKKGDLSLDDLVCCYAKKCLLFDNCVE